MDREIVYLSSFKRKSTEEFLFYIGKHLTHDDLWPEPGCVDPYIGSSSILMKKRERIGCTILDLKEDFEWLGTEILEVCQVKNSLYVERNWILSGMFVMGIHPLAKEKIKAHDNTSILLKIHDGNLVNCHYNEGIGNPSGFENYEKFIKLQAYRSKLGNSKEAREKAKITREKHKEEIAKAQSKRMHEYALTDKGKLFISMISKLGNTEEANKKKRETKWNKAAHWICLERLDLKEDVLRYLSISLGLGRGAQQCWSRLGYPDEFEFKKYHFKKVKEKE